MDTIIEKLDNSSNSSNSSNLDNLESKSLIEDDDKHEEEIQKIANKPLILSSNDSNKSLIFIDLSYYIFYRFYALVSWYKKAYPDEKLDIQNIMDNQIFVEKFKKLFIENIKKIKKKYNIENCIIIFAKDCRRNLIWRNKYYPDYKKTRDDKNITFNPDIFLYVYNEILPKYIDNKTTYVYSIKTAEADDIIAIMKNYIRDKYSDIKIYIITNDHDYLQLADYYTYIYNLKGFDLKKKGKGLPEIDLGFKIIKGDISDNIKGVFKKKITNKTIFNIIYDKEKLNKQIDEEGIECRKRYELNCLLIDFKNIPKNIQNIIKSFITFNN